MDYPQTWSGIGEIWTADAWSIGRCRLVISDGQLVVSTKKKSITFSPSEVVEVRMFRRPLPSVTIIFREGEAHALISFCVLRGRLLESTLQHFGIPITEVRTWRTGFEAKGDEKKYQLQP